MPSAYTGNSWPTVPHQSRSRPFSHRLLFLAYSGLLNGHKTLPVCILHIVNSLYPSFTVGTCVKQEQTADTATTHCIKKKRKKDVTKSQWAKLHDSSSIQRACKFDSIDWYTDAARRGMDSEDNKDLFGPTD